METIEKLPPITVKILGDTDKPLNENIERHTAKNGIEILMGTTRGGRPDKPNEDFVGFCESADGTLTLALVDGMGGHQDGGRAAEIVCKNLVSEQPSFHVAATASSLDMRASGVHEEGGACFTACRITFDPKVGKFTMMRSHTGDVRNAVLTNGIAMAQTRDHIFANMVVDRVGWDQKVADNHPLAKRVIDPVGPKTSSEIIPEVEVELPFGSIVWLASDGLWRGLPAEACAILVQEQGGDLQKTIEIIADMLDTKDNRSIVLAKIPDAVTAGQEKPQEAERIHWMKRILRGLVYAITLGKK